MSMNVQRLTDEVLSFWFGPLDDASTLDREVEPFASYFMRWYGKSPEIDAAIRERFGPTLRSATSTAQSWREVQRAVAGHARASLAVTILVDQLPRNMYRDSAQMYQHDGLALAHAYSALQARHDAGLSLVERMFAYVPLMHAEDLTLQHIVEAHFADLARDAAQRSPHNLGFFEFALGYARRHREVIERFGRFPHRNAILGRESTNAEQDALRTEDIAF